MPFVVDASVIIGWALGEIDPRVVETREGLQRDSGLAPSLWSFEVRNALVQNERRGRVSEAESTGFLDKLGRLPISLDQSPDPIAIMTLARRHRLTVYDAAYLELAMREALPLATLDEPLANAARAQGVPLVGEAA